MKQMFIVGLLIMVVVISGCSTQKIQTQSATDSSVGESGIKKDVEISGFSFNPSTLTIPKGATVIWTNIDSAEHTIVSDTGGEINSDPISKGETYAQTFNKLGTYEYHCGIHPSMEGNIIVE